MKSNKSSLVQETSGWDHDPCFRHTREEKKSNRSFCKRGTKSEADAHVDETQKTENKYSGELNPHI